MTVQELIEKLQKLPQDSLVLTRGYECGYDKAIFAETIDNIRYYPTENNWQGEYIDDGSGDGDIIPAVYIGSNRG